MPLPMNRVWISRTSAIQWEPGFAGAHRSVRSVLKWVARSMRRAMNEPVPCIFRSVDLVSVRVGAGITAAAVVEMPRRSRAIGEESTERLCEDCSEREGCIMRIMIAVLALTGLLGWTPRVVAQEALKI